MKLNRLGLDEEYRLEKSMKKHHKHRSDHKHTTDKNCKSLVQLIIEKLRGM
jgi:hypothetical protein